MASDILVSETLRGGFWPSSRFGLDVEDKFMDDGTIREEYAEDAPFVGRRRNCLVPSFRIGRDVYAGYFIVVRSADGDLCPFWVARAVINPSPDLVTATRFRFSIGCLTLFNMYMLTHMLGGIQRKGMCGMRTRASCLLGPKLIVS
jgi:hypothetical protein